MNEKFPACSNVPRTEENYDALLKCEAEKSLALAKPLWEKLNTEFKAMLDRKYGPEHHEDPNDDWSPLVRDKEVPKRVSKIGRAINSSYYISGEVFEMVFEGGILNKNFSKGDRIALLAQARRTNLAVEAKIRDLEDTHGSIENMSSVELLDAAEELIPLFIDVFEAMPKPGKDIFEDAVETELPDITPFKVKAGIAYLKSFY